MDGCLLQASDGPAAVVDNPRGLSPIVLVCEHAGNAVPGRLHGLDLDAAVLESHAGLDIGALGVARALSQALDAPLVHQRFSRLVYDCNRPPEAPDCMPVASEIYAIPANSALSAEARAQRIEEIYQAFHGTLAEVIDGRLSRGHEPILVTIHTFTRVYNGTRRTVDLGILDDADQRLADRLMGLVPAALPGFTVRRNDPYGPADGVTHTLKRHAIARGLENVMFEIANDLVRSDADQHAWAERLTTLLREAAGQATEIAGMPKRGRHAL